MTTYHIYSYQMTKRKAQSTNDKLDELSEFPYHCFDQVDYHRIMALKIPAIKIDSKNEREQMKANAKSTKDDNS